MVKESGYELIPRCDLSERYSVKPFYRIPCEGEVENLNLYVSLVAPSARGVGGLVPMLLEKDASSSKRFLLAIARDSF
ncbi:hypothetical protein Tco_0332457 [Tanacetum coccineum]